MIMQNEYEKFLTEKANKEGYMDFLASFPLRLIFLMIFGLFLFGPLLSAQDFSSPRVLVQSSPESPTEGSSWTITILVDHPLPLEVQVRLPPLPPELSLERMSSEPRLIQKPAGEAEGVAATLGIDERWTAVEYQFSLLGAGQVVLEPFEVTLPDGHILTAPITLTVQGIPVTEFSPQPGWKNPPSVLRVGEAAELILTLSGWESQRALPESRLFLPKTPPGAIFEQAPIIEGDREQGILLRINVIPLGEGFFVLPQTLVAFEEFTLNVPALRIPVTAAALNPVSAVISATPASAAGVAAIVIPFPDIQPKAFREIRERAEALWNDGRRAEALAELRRNERDHFAGPALVPLRREAEQVLGLDQAQENEKWRPRVFLGAGFLLSLGLLILSGIIINIPRTVTIAFSRGYKSILIILFVIMGVCLYGLGDSARRLLPGSAQYALVRETEARRVPEPDGAVNVRFKEGERARVSSGHLNWAYAESGTGAGWVRIRDIIFY
ncbi:hypothetical protein AGMMS49579_18150 [Spirochaetia bacterium]|nr:hypothetical protein AGMMS49579_18150 [Spirochaetia bacterium]